MQIENNYINLDNYTKQKIKLRKLSLKSLYRLLLSNSIEVNLKKGFTIVKKSNKIIKRSTELEKNDSLKIRFFDDQVKVKVDKN